MSGTQSGGSVEAIAARLTSWAAIHGSLPPATFFAIYFPALKDGEDSRGRRRPPVAPPGALRRPPPLPLPPPGCWVHSHHNPVCLATPTEGLAIMTSRDFLSLVEAMHGLLLRAGVRGLAALAQQQQVGGWGIAFGRCVPLFPPNRLAACLPIRCDLWLAAETNQERLSPFCRMA